MGTETKKTDPKFWNPFLTSNRFFAIRLPVDTRRRLRAAPRLLFGHDLHRHVGGDVGHEADGDRVVAQGLDRTERGTNLALLDLEAELVKRFGNVGVRHGTEQTAVNTGLAGDGDRLTVDLAGEFFRGSDAFGLSLFEFGTTGFEFSDGRLRRTLGVALRDQEVTSVAVLNLNDSAEFTEVIDFFEKNDLHD